MIPQTQRFKEIAREQMADAYAKGFLDLFPVALSAMRVASYSGFAPPVEANACSAAIRAEAVAHLPDLLEQFEHNATQAGARVYWAVDGRDANDYIVRLAKARKVTYVTKGKSMVTEETGLNEELAAAGIKAYETDLGEFITQLLHRPPFHIVGPAINIHPKVICDIFMEKGIITEPTVNPVELGYAARCYLRDKFHHLEMGVTGVNLAVAESGTIINVENEGNIRLSKSSPDIQVSVMTIEKVVPTMVEALHVLRCLCRSATGQRLGAYVSMDTGPKKINEVDGPSELHIVILDNGRSKIFADPEYRAALQCIRCGACLNNCPVYRKVGGYAYGWAYSGPMGQVLTPLLLGLSCTRNLYEACTLCRNCTDVCPGGVPHTLLLRRHRSKNREKDKEFGGAGLSFSREAGFRLFATAATNPLLWRAMTAGTRVVVNRQSRDGVIRQILGKSEGWLAARDLPSMGRPTFKEWYQKNRTER